MDAAALFLRTFLVGVAVAAPVGAMGVLCMQRTVARGWRAGMVTGMGIATADGIYGGLAAFGVAAIANGLVSLQGPLRIVGGLVLVWMGWRAVMTPPVHDGSADTSAAGYAAVYVGSVGLTLANPMTIMAFAAVFAGAGLAAQPGTGAALVATVGVACGSLSWWVALTSATAAARHAAGDNLVRWVNRTSGVVIIGFGLLALVAGVSIVV